MTTTLTPPPVPAAGPETPRPPRTAARVITILTAALGAAILVVIAWGGIRAGVAAAAATNETATASTAGIDRLDVDISAASLTLAFDDVEEATLDVRDAHNGPWVLERRGDTLRVHTPRMAFLGWFGGGNGRGVLTLPAELEGSDAQLSLGAGSIDADGAFGALSLDMGAGDTTVRGSAESLRVEVSAGRADLDLDGVTQAELQLSAGDLDARLTGPAPELVSVSVSAGTLRLGLPDDTYDVRSDVSAGNLDNGLRTGSAASARVVVDVSAGSVTLRPLP